VRTAGAVDDAIAGFAFAPDPITIKAGQTIRWTNKDSFAHTVKSATFASADLAQGGSYARQFPTAGTFTYLCGIHNSMTGTVIVTP
jgi:plastocyanin